MCVTGTARGAVRGSTDVSTHMWCVAELDGSWCHIDPTWGDPSHVEEGVELATQDGTALPEWFGLDDETLARTGRTVDDSDLVPACQTHDHDQLSRMGCVVHSDDEAELVSVVRAQLEDGGSNVAVVRVEDEALWSRVLASMEPGARFVLDDLLEEVALSRGMWSLRYETSYDEGLRVMRVVLLA